MARPTLPRNRHLEAGDLRFIAKALADQATATKDQNVYDLAGYFAATLLDAADAIDQSADDQVAIILRRSR